MAKELAVRRAHKHEDFHRIAFFSTLGSVVGVIVLSLDGQGRFAMRQLSPKRSTLCFLESLGCARASHDVLAQHLDFSTLVQSVRDFKPAVSELLIPERETPRVTG